MKLVKKQISVSQGVIELYTITTQHGFEVTLCNYGASIYEIAFIKDQKKDVLTLTPENIEVFLSSKAYFGKTVGRTSGRLSTPNYQIKGKTYEVKPYISQDAKLHGGQKGFALQVFKTQDIIESSEEVKIVFSHFSPHMEEGYPGNLKVKVIYQITAHHEIIITHEAISDEDTVLNMNNHTYFNLSSHQEDVLAHKLYVDADTYVDVDESYQFKAILPVKNTPLDFHVARPIKEAIDYFKDKAFKGLDHVFNLNHNQKVVAKLYDEKSTYGVTVKTTYPVLVLYTYNFPTQEKFLGKKMNQSYAGVTLECQYEPDGIHHKALHSAILDKGNLYHHITVYAFYKDVSYEKI